MPVTSDIALWGRAVPEWVVQALSASGRPVSDVGGGDSATRGFPSAKRHDDIRTFSARTAGMTLLCTDLLAANDASLLAEGRSLIFSVEPLPAAACVGPRPPRVCLLPGLAHDSTLALAGSAAAESGPCRHALVEASAPPAYGSALARVADAARAIIMWMGMPDGVTCALSGARPTRVREDVPDAASRAMGGFGGTISCLMRYADARGAALVASASAPQWARRAHLQLGSGMIVADDARMVRLDASGATVEHADAPGRPAATPVDVAAECIASDAELERTQPESLATRTAALLEAICLSGITGEWEEPARIEDILSRSSRFADD